MKELENMTRKELAEFIVNAQIKNGLVKPENKEFQIRGRLKGCGALKPQSKEELYRGAKAFIEG